MAYTAQYGTGFECGSVWILSASQRNGGALTLVDPHTGTYALNLDVNWWYWLVDSTPSSLYVGVWVKARGIDLNERIRVVMTDDTYVELARRSSPYRWDLYVGAGNVAEGSVILPDVGNWHSIQVYFEIGDSGNVQTKIDGIDDINYSGDTKPGTSSSIKHVLLYGVSDYSYWDDLTFGAGGWPGDVRFEKLVPDADDAVQWSRSAGADNYALVDEVPPSDADYVYTTTDAHKDMYTLGDFDTTGKTPLFVTQWCRAKKDEAAAHQLELVMDDGTESIDSPQDLLVTYSYLRRLMTSKPSGGAWDDAALDALKIGQRAQIV